MEYCVVKNSNLDLFVEEVNERLRYGWSINDSIVVDSTIYTLSDGETDLITYYYQVMVKWNNED